MPILLTLVVGGLTPALILLVWVLIHQLIENCWLWPKISAAAMEMRGGMAFGAGPAGGRLQGRWVRSWHCHSLR